MKFGNMLGSALIFATLASGTALADDHRGRDRHDRHEHRHDDHRHHDKLRDDKRHDRRHAFCPPGLAKKDRACVPPGQARRHRHPHVGDVFDRRAYTHLRDPHRYQLEDRRSWDYYRDDNRIYRIDRHTQKVLAVMNLIQAFSR
ncbi:hypothetical protein [Paracoccus laeviglucosivorans]|uniref:Regulator RcnB of Ni and Co efflux n=1 Tax=Paracoccus laeviglucosivorans TaxID=1197861 RepID=A0A521E339_9RHOB|nr:hypothetical protein [Paracoccus laeviglucosivorans]SMO78367.1 hypothetical protein SAMN06265221_11120 [Paracoccus laeviglucosivorans]